MCNVQTKLWRPNLVLAVSMLAFTNSMSRIQAEPLRAGVAVESITRVDPTGDIHDLLHAKALVLADDARRVAILSLDVIGAPVTLVSDIRAQLQTELGFEASNVLINASHNHRTL